MKLKKLVFTFFVLTFLYNNSFCMQEKMEQEKFKREQEVDNKMLKNSQELTESSVEDMALNILSGKKVETYGKRLHNSLMSYLKKSSLPQDKINETIETSISNVIKFSLYKAKNSVDAISEELRGVPLLGSVVKTPGLSWVINKVSKFVANKLFDFDTVLKDSDKIKDEAKDILKKDLLAFVCSEDEKSEKSEKLEWFGEKINFNEDKSGIKVNFLNSDFSKMDLFEKKHPRTAFELLCFATTFASSNKEFLINAFKKAGVSEMLHNTFYTQLSGNVSKIEGKIDNLYFPKQESKGKELVVKN